MDKIKGVLHNVFEDLVKRHGKPDFKKAQQALKDVVGPKASAHTRIVYLTKEKIRVNVNSSAWLYDLNLKKNRITRELKKTLNIRDVEFRLGDIKPNGENS